MKFYHLPVEIFRPEKVLQNIKDLERCIHSDQAILETVLRATDNTLETPEALLQPPLEGLVNLGILLTGMGWWNISHRAWLVLIERHDLEAVDVVFKGAIAAMNIDPQKLAIGTAWALEEIKRLPSHELDSIAISLLTQNSLRNNSQELGTLSEVYSNLSKAYFNFHDQIPRVPAEPRWELAKNVNLSPQALVRALKHPSEKIRLNAAQLLKYGAGGDEAV